MKKEKYYTYKLNMLTLNILAIILFIIVSAIVIIIEIKDNYIIDSSLNILIYMVLWLILHELLHGIGFAIFKQVNKKNITFGMSIEKGVFYCMCKQEIDRKVILTSLLFPLTIIGIITLIIGMIINNYYLVLLSIMNIVGAIGDIVMTIYFLKVKNVKYLDLDDCTSFTVISPDDLTKVKVPGVKLIDTGNYDKDKIKPHNKKKITISKPSYIIFVIIIIILILNITKIL